MNTSDRDRLLLDYLDGTLSPADRAVVEDALAHQTGWRTRHAELAGMFQRLARIEPATPPAELRARVMERIRAGVASDRAGVVSERAGWISWFRNMGPRPRIVVAVSFAAGLALGVLAMGPARHALDELPLGGSSVLGTMGGAVQSPAPVAVSLSDARMTGQPVADGAIWRVTVVLTLPEGATAELGDPGNERAPISLRRRAGSAGNVRVEAHRTVWSGPLSGRYDVEFSSAQGSPSPLEMTLNSSTGTSQATLPLDHSAAR